MAKNSTKEYTPEQIAALKKKHGDIFLYEADGMSCILKRPGRTVISAATMVAADGNGKTDPMKFAEIILTNCWIEGDETLRDNDGYFLGLQQQINEMIEVKVGKLKKL